MNLLGLTPEDLVAHLEGTGFPATLTEARRVLCRVISDGAHDPTPIKRQVRKALVDHVRAATTWDRPVVEERVVDPEDGSVRYLFRAADGVRFEAVRIGLKKADHYTVCLSSQAGCAMACAFCATGRLGLTRNLTAAEIVGQFLTVRDEAPGRISGAVFMGQGEPFHNYEQVIQAAKVLSHPAGGRIAQPNVTISTVGLAPQIRRFTREGHAYKLIVSLTSARPELRRELLPVAGKVPFEDVIDALREHAEALKLRSKPGSIGRLVTVAWVLLGGVNDGPAEVEAIRRLFDGLQVRLNLIDVNDARVDGFRRSTDAERAVFLDGLRTLGVPVVRRYSVGRSRHSACGMLASRKLAELDATPA